MLTKTQGIRLVGQLVIGLALSLMANAFFTTVVSAGSREVQGRKVQKRTRAAPKPRVNYTAFSHGTHVTQQKLECDACHKFPTKNSNEVRQGDAAFPDVADFPEHSSCLSCHRQQFFARERPAPKICSNCHVNVTPRDTTRYLFPSLGDVQSTTARPRREGASEFAVNFSHEKHLEVVGLNKAPVKRRNPFAFVTVSFQQKPAASPEPPKSCPVCHETYLPQGDSDEEYVTKPPKDIGDNFWLKKGTFKTVPVSHTGCFSCHNVDAGIAPAPSECKVCHQLAVGTHPSKSDFQPTLAQTMKVTDHRTLAMWSQRHSSGTYRHEAGEHPNISCLNCHNVSAMNTTDRKTQVVNVRSCGGAEGCHVTATSDDGGILNYELDQKRENASFVCSKCHLDFGKGPAPESHVKAIQALKKS